MHLKTEPTFHLEKKRYAEDASTEEVTAIKNRVYLHNNQIIYYKEVPITTPFTTNLMFDKIDELANKMGPCGLIFDISTCEKPDSVARRSLNNHIKKLPDNIHQAAFIIKDNILIKTAAKFVMFQSNLKSYSINTTLEEAELSINKILNA